MIPLLHRDTPCSATRGRALHFASLVLVVVLLSSLCVVDDAHACRSGLSIADRTGAFYTDGSDGTTVDLGDIHFRREQIVRRPQGSFVVPDDVNPFDPGSTRSDPSRSPPGTAASSL
jgi:hypothetical protein